MTEQQTTLTRDPPMILDATCSFYHNWPKHATIRMDIRPIVEPDIVGDITKTIFPNHYFDAIYLDPPHMIRKDPMILGHDLTQIKRRLSGRLSRGMYEHNVEGIDISRYGFFKTKEEWYDFLDKVNVELLRILKPTGKTYWKLTFDIDSRGIKEKDIERLTNWQVIERKITKSKKPRSKNVVHWLTMIPKLTTEDRKGLP